MPRRRLTIKRLDPWSVLKFGAFANVVLFAVFLLVAWVIWFIIDRLRLIDQACDIALDVGFTSCGINGGNLFQALLLLGGMWVIVQTAVFVFFAFLHNLIADLTGGLVIGVVEEGPPTTPPPRTGPSMTASSAGSGRQRSAPPGDGSRPDSAEPSTSSTRSQSASRPDGGSSVDEPLFRDES